jgi:transcription initiation factor TFIIH subunit 2
MDAQRRAMDGEPMEEDGLEDAEDDGGDREAYERAYADERSWEELQEDESGLLRPLDVAQQQRQHRKRVAAMAGPHIQRGIIRYLYLMLDLSRVCPFSSLVPLLPPCPPL